MAELGIELLNKIVPDAYHATELSVAIKIQAEQNFVEGTSDKLFLGDGSYFYEGSVRLAERWGRNEGRRRGWKTYGVLQATIQLGRCLDLNAPEYYEVLEDWAEELIERVKGIKDPNDVTPAWVLNYFVKKGCRDEVDTIRCSHFNIDHGPLFPNAMIYRSRLVICVRNTEKISGISLFMRGLVI